MTLRVLLVDDRKAVREATAELLRTVGGFRIVAELATEAEARHWLDEHRGQWDLAVVDLILEQGTGMGVVAKARATHPAAHIAVFSDYATAGIRAHCQRLGADAVFLKSTEVAAFADWLSALAGPAPTASPM